MVGPSPPRFRRGCRVVFIYLKKSELKWIGMGAQSPLSVPPIFLVNGLESGPPPPMDRTLGRFHAIFQHIPCLLRIRLGLGRDSNPPMSGLPTNLFASWNLPRGYVGMHFPRRDPNSHLLMMFSSACYEMAHTTPPVN